MVGAPLRQTSMERIEIALQSAMSMQNVKAIRALMKERNEAKVRAKARAKARQKEEVEQQQEGGGGGETKSGGDGRHRLSDEGKRLFHSTILTCPVCLSGEGGERGEGGEGGEGDGEGEGGGEEDCFIETSCGHHVHVRCAKSMIKKMWTGTRVSFNYLRCCACRAPLSHASLDDVMAPH